MEQTYIKHIVGPEEEVLKEPLKAGQLLIAGNDDKEKGKIYYDIDEEHRMEIGGTGKTTAEGGEIFNDYVENKAGMKGFRILSAELTQGSDEEYNENLIPFPYEFMTDFDGTFPYVREINGVTVTVNKDRSVVLNGTTNGNFQILLGNVSLENTDYYLSGNPSSWDDSWLYGLAAAGSIWYGDRLITSEDIINLDVDNARCEIYFPYGNETFNNTIFYPKLEKGYYPTSFYPPTSSTLVCELEETTEGLEIGDIPSLRLSWNHMDIGSISAIEGNNVIISLDGEASSYNASQFKLVSLENQEKCPWYNTLVVNKKPDIGNIIVGIAAHAEGLSNKAYKVGSHAEGWNNVVYGDFGHAEGQDNIVGYCAHAEGRGHNAMGEYAHTEGQQNEATGMQSHAEGYLTKATNDDAATPKGSNISDGRGNHAEGIDTVSKGTASHAEGISTMASNKGAHSEGINTRAQGIGAHAEGGATKATGEYAHTEGGSSVAEGSYSHAEGDVTNAKAKGAHSEGSYTIAEGEASHAEGFYTYAKGANSHAEGRGSSTNAPDPTKGALGAQAHVEGYLTTASAANAHAEGSTTKASGAQAHAEGNWSNATGVTSHAEGEQTNATGKYAHSEGKQTRASGEASHAGGIGTVAGQEAQTAVGKYNNNKTNTLYEVGNGTSNTDRKNAFEVYKDGHAEVQTQGFTDNSVVTKGYLEAKIDNNDNFFKHLIKINDSGEDSILVNQLNVSSLEAGNIYELEFIESIPPSGGNGAYDHSITPSEYGDSDLLIFAKPLKGKKVAVLQIYYDGQPTTPPVFSDGSSYGKVSQEYNSIWIYTGGAPGNYNNIESVSIYKIKKTYSFEESAFLSSTVVNVNTDYNEEIKTRYFFIENANQVISDHSQGNLCAGFANIINKLITLG